MNAKVREGLAKYREEDRESKIQQVIRYCTWVRDDANALEALHMARAERDPNHDVIEILRENRTKVFNSIPKIPRVGDDIWAEGRRRFQEVTA